MAEDGVQEEFRLVPVDNKHQVLGVHLISVGLLNQSLVAPREVFLPAIRDAAAAVILVHNHPSGDASASPEDLGLTGRLEQVAQTIGIKFLDHIIVARQGCVSIREHQRRSLAWRSGYFYPVEEVRRGWLHDPFFVNHRGHA